MSSDYVVRNVGNEVGAAGGGWVGKHSSPWPASSPAMAKFPNYRGDLSHTVFVHMCDCICASDLPATSSAVTLCSGERDSP